MNESAAQAFGMVAGMLALLGVFLLAMLLWPQKRTDGRYVPRMATKAGETPKFGGDYPFNDMDAETARRRQRVHQQDQMDRTMAEARRRLAP